MELLAVVKDCSFENHEIPSSALNDQPEDSNRRRWWPAECGRFC